MRETSATVLHWTAGEGAGTTTQDSTGLGHTGTFAGTAAWVKTGRFTNAYSFDGTAGNIVSTASTTDLKPAAISILAWVNPAAAGSYPMFVSKQGASSGYELRMHASALTAELAINDAVVATDTTPMVVGTWYFLVGTYDGANLRIYKDGVQVGSFAYTTALAGNNNALAIGDRAAGGQPYSGRIDDVQIRNVAMTAAEVLAEFELLPSVTCYA